MSSINNVDKEMFLQYEDAALEKSLAMPDCAARCYPYLLRGGMTFNTCVMLRLIGV